MDADADRGAGAGGGRDAFELLDDDTRLAIVRALARRRAERPRSPALSFSALREATGVRDSGRFNYHLDRLRGRVVEKVPAGDRSGADGAGYRLTPTGERLASTVLAGVYEGTDARDPVDLDADCFVCGAPLQVRYEDGLVSVVCPDGHGMRDSFPPGAVEGRSMPAVASLMELVGQQEIELAREGVCPACYGEMSPGVERTDHHAGEGEAVPDWVPSYTFRARCECCGLTLSHYVGGAVRRHPAIVSLYHDHGVDVRERPAWDLSFVTDDPEVVGEDPLRLRVTAAVGGDAVTLTLDGTASVVDVTDRHDVGERP